MKKKEGYDSGSASGSASSDHRLEGPKRPWCTNMTVDLFIYHPNTYETVREANIVDNIILRKKVFILMFDQNNEFL